MDCDCYWRRFLCGGASGAGHTVFLSGPPQFAPSVSPHQVFSCQERGMPEGKQKRLSLHLCFPSHPSGMKIQDKPSPFQTSSLHTKLSLLDCISPLHPFQASCILHPIFKLFITQRKSSSFNLKVRFPFGPSQIPSQFFWEKRGGFTAQITPSAALSPVVPNCTCAPKDTVVSLKLLSSTYVGCDYTPPLCGEGYCWKMGGYRQHKEDRKHWEVIWRHS